MLHAFYAHLCLSETSVERDLILKSFVYVCAVGASQPAVVFVVVSLLTRTLGIPIDQVSRVLDLGQFSAFESTPFPLDLVGHLHVSWLLGLQNRLRHTWRSLRPVIIFEKMIVVLILLGLVYLMITGPNIKVFRCV